MQTIKDVKMLEFPQRGDARGAMIVAEGNADIPFEIKRIFYSYDTDKAAVRGLHSNRKTEFVLISVAGSCSVKVKDVEGGEKVYRLDAPHKGIYLPKLLWKEMYDFSTDCVLLVLASEHYDSGEYIRDYNELRREFAEV